MKGLIHITSTRTHTYPRPHHSFRFFPGLAGSHELHYIGSDQRFFPIGNIGDKRGFAITPDGARKVIDEVFRSRYEPLIHLALSPHDGNLGIEHNHVITLEHLNFRSATYVADGIIIPKPKRLIRAKPLGIETMLGDCAIVVLGSENYLGYMHVGRPEAMAEPSIIQAMFKAWPEDLWATRAFLSPVICGRHYGLKTLPPRFEDYTEECNFPGETGFSLYGLITYALAEKEIVYETSGSPPDYCPVCPYCEREKGNEEWASDQFFKRTRPGEYSPRDCAMMEFHW